MAQKAIIITCIDCGDNVIGENLTRALSRLTSHRRYKKHIRTMRQELNMLKDSIVIGENLTRALSRLTSHRRYKKHDRR